MKIQIVVSPYHAAFDPIPVRQFLLDVGEKVKDIMVQQAAAPKSGKMYHIKGRVYQASAAGEFPANKFGHLSASYRFEVESTQVTIGTDVPIYPAYLRAGTIKMAKRRFLKEALQDTMEMEHIKSSFVKWRHG